MFNLLIAFILGFNVQSTTAVTTGQYYEVVKVEYEAQTNTTYGVFVRYGIDEQGNKSKQHLQLRSLEGQKTEADLQANAPHDSNITMVK